MVDKGISIARSNRLGWEPVDLKSETGTRLQLKPTVECYCTGVKQNILYRYCSNPTFCTLFMFTDQVKREVHSVETPLNGGGGG